MSLMGSEKQANNIAVNTDPPEPVSSMNVSLLGKDQAIVMSNEGPEKVTEYRNSEM